MTSWEQVINEVVIPGDAGKILNVKGKWELALAGIADAKRYLDDGLIDLTTWEGAAGDAYRTSIGEIAKKLRTLTEDYESMPSTLQAAATQMDTIRSQIPIPDSMMEDIGGASLLFANTGVLQTLAVGDIFNSLKADFSVDGLRDGMGNVLHGLGSVASHIPGIGGHVESALDGLRDWVSTQDDEAVRLYNQLNGDYAGTAADVPASSYVPGSRDLNVTPIPLDGMPNSGGLGGMPSAGGMGGMPGGAGFDPTVGTSGISDFNTPGVDTTGTDDFGTGDFGTTDFTDPDLSTGLAGAGPGGLTGLGTGGLGSGGLGGGGLSGGGLGGGLGAGGLGAGGGVGGAGRFPGMGTPVSPMMPMGGMAGGAGAGGARSGRGAGGRAGAGRTGMMGMGPHGGAGHGSDDEHGTWLQEDEDVWGADNNASPPLLT